MDGQTLFEKNDQKENRTQGSKGGVATLYPTTTAALKYKTEAEKMDTLVQKAHRILVTISSIFPFDFFPDKIVVDENKVDMIVNYFFFSEQVYSVLIKNINNVSLSTNPFFASLTLELSGYETNPPIIRYLWKPQALRVRRMIMGLVACSKEGIDTSRFTDGELVTKVEEIGRARET